ncbi:YeiH family protein [Niallia sp. JL1B1071]|uniref:YeiH family protein n=1 Tax=Niallia tiangongensis TaxID=3237105 RepID=UPI0037DD7560
METNDKTHAKRYGWIMGVGITLVIAVFAKYLAEALPILSIMGPLVLAILIGMAWRALFGLKVKFEKGIAFSNKRLLRLGIILLGMRLNLFDIYHAGMNIIIIAIVVIVFTLFSVYGLTQFFKVEKKIGILTACGTAICGAAAVAAIAVPLKAKEEETAVAAATVAILGTIFTLIYTVLYSVLPLTSKEYGIFAGSTLHEVAHVIAAASIGGDGTVDMAVIVKLTRVALLVPVAIIIGLLFSDKEDGNKSKKVLFTIFPWFILGFLIMSGINTLGIVPKAITAALIDLAYLFIGMAMAGLGLQVEGKTFKKLGIKPFIAGLIGSVLLSFIGYALVKLLW